MALALTSTRDFLLRGHTSGVALRLVVRLVVLLRHCSSQLASLLISFPLWHSDEVCEPLVEFPLVRRMELSQVGTTLALVPLLSPRRVCERRGRAVARVWAAPLALLQVAPVQSARLTQHVAVRRVAARSDGLVELLLFATHNHTLLHRSPSNVLVTTMFVSCHFQ